MRPLRRPLDPVARPLDRDAGFTLVEVVVALSLLAVLSTAALYFFVSGTRTVTHQQRSHGAVSAANDAMEQVFSYVPEMVGSGSTSSSGLLVGRRDTDVSAAWAAAAAAGVPGLSDTYPAWDRATSPAPLAGTQDDRVDVVRTVESSGVTYDVTTLIGYCYRVATNANGSCTRVGGDSVGSPSAGYVVLLRAIVDVRWPGTASSCAGGTCSYQIQSLVDPNTDLKWNNTTRLQAIDDGVMVDAGETVVIDVLTNDSVMELTALNPVSRVSDPQRGATPVGSATYLPSGQIRYTAPIDGYGEVTFVYRVSVASLSSQATVRVFIKPKAPDLSGTAKFGSSVDLDIPSPPGGVTAGSLTVVEGPASGSVAPRGSAGFRYTAPTVTTGPKTVTFRYKYTDLTGAETLVGVGTIQLVTHLPGVTPPLSYRFVYSDSNEVRALPVARDSGNTGYQTIFPAAPAEGSLTVAAGARVPYSTTPTWKQPAKYVGQQTFGYQIVTPDDSVVSPELGQVTITVPPVAQPKDTLTIKAKKNSTVSGTVTLSGLPTVAPGMTFKRETSPSCATAKSGATSTSQVFEVKKNAGNATCEFTYTVTYRGVTSDPRAVTIKVSKP